MLRLKWLVATVFFAVLAILVACSGSGSSTGIPPITGIVIRAEKLTEGRGCGRGEGQVFKYAAVVYGYKGNDAGIDELASYDVALTAGLYDCFADGTFVELPRENGSFTYRLEVFVFNEAAYLAARDRIDAVIGVTTRDSVVTVAAGLRTTSPTWTTTCTATQLRDVQALAVCEPLVSGLLPTTVILRTGAFSRADGRVSTCGRATTDGGTDGGSDGGDGGGEAGVDAATTLLDAATTLLDAGADGGDAGDGGTPTGTGLTFFTVRARGRTNGTEVVPTRDLACPEAFVIPNATPGAAYEIDVTLLDESGASVGSTTCSARAAFGVETPATCNAIQ